MNVRFRFRNTPWEEHEGMLEETGILPDDYTIWYLDTHDNLIPARNVLDWIHPGGRFKNIQLTLFGHGRTPREASGSVKPAQYAR